MGQLDLVVLLLLGDLQYPVDLKDQLNQVIPVHLYFLLDRVDHLHQ